MTHTAQECTCTGNFGPSVLRPPCLTLSPITFGTTRSRSFSQSCAVSLVAVRTVLLSQCRGLRRAVCVRVRCLLPFSFSGFGPRVLSVEVCPVPSPVSEDKGLSPSVSSGAARALEQLKTHLERCLRTSVSKGPLTVKCWVEHTIPYHFCPSPVFQHVPSDVTTGSCLLFLCLHCRRQTPLRRYLSPAHYFWAPRRKHLYCWCQMLPLRGNLVLVRNLCAARHVPLFHSKLMLCTRRSFCREFFWQAEHATVPNASTAQKCCIAGLILVGLKRTWNRKLSFCVTWHAFLVSHLFQFRFADTEQYCPQVG